MKRIVALLLAVLMVVGLFAGCQKNDPAPGGDTTPAGSEGKETKPAETEKKEIPTILWYTVGGGKAPNHDSWTEKMNAYMEEKIGVHLDLQIIPWGDFDTRVSNMITTNDPFDIMFGDHYKYRKHVDMNAYLDIKPLLDQVPALRDLVPQPVWDAATINGSIYGVPTYKDVACQFHWQLDVPFAEEFAPNYKELHSLEDMTAPMRAYKEATGKMPMVGGGMDVILPYYDPLALGIGAYGVSLFDEGAPKIVETYRHRDAKHHLEILYQWIEEGLKNDDGAVRKDVARSEFVISLGQGWASAWVGSVPPVVTTSFHVPVMSNSTCLGSINQISSSSKHPVEALKVLELVNTDTWVRDSFRYGEEGVNWNYVEENGEKKVHQINADWTGANYTQGQFFIETPLEGTVGNPFVDEVLVQNENAVVSPCIGFYPDTSEIDDKLDELRGIHAEFGKLISNGYGGVDTINELYSRLDEAGAQEVIAELQRQLDEWWAAKNA